MECNSDTGNIKDLVDRITLKLESMAVPIDVREFSMEEYRKVFPQGTVNTPIGKVISSQY